MSSCTDCKDDLMHFLRNRLLSLKYHVKHGNMEACMNEIQLSFEYLEEFDKTERGSNDPGQSSDK